MGPTMLSGESFSEFVSYMCTSMVPEPLSDHYKEGGMFYGLNEDASQIAFFMGCLFLIDNLLVKPYLSPKSRYFTLHACANTVTCLAAWPDVVRAYTDDPHTVFLGPAYTMVGNSATIALHLYHMMAFKVTQADLFHHLTFVGCLCGPAIPFKQVGGIAINLSCFFLSGLPGGIDYVMLVLVYEGKMAKATEKKWFSIINAYFRGPSMVVYAFTWWTGFWAGKTHPPQLVWAFIVLLHYYNGQYYSKQAVESAAVFFYKEEQRKKKMSESMQHSDGLVAAEFKHPKKD